MAARAAWRDTARHAHRCEDVVSVPGRGVLPCSNPATQIVDVNRPGSSEGPYRMCDACADHSVRNRGMKIVGSYIRPEEPPVPKTVSRATAVRIATDMEYLRVARDIIAGTLPLKRAEISPGQWETAQAIVGKMLGASNETYVHPNLLCALCENIADGLDRYFDLGVKAAGGDVIEHKGRR